MRRLILCLVVLCSFSAAQSQLQSVVNEFYGTWSTGEEVYRIFAELDEDTRNQLRAVLIGDTAPVRGLALALQDEGYQISRDAVFHARKVLRGDLRCPCLVALEADANE